MAITRIPRLDTSAGDYFSEGLGEGLDNTFKGLKGYLDGRREEKENDKKVAKLKGEKTEEEKKQFALKKRESGAFAEWLRQNDYSDEQIESLRYAPLKLAGAIMQGDVVIPPVGRNKKQKRMAQALMNPVPNIGQQLGGQQLPQFEAPEQLLYGQAEQQMQSPQLQQQQMQQQQMQQQQMQQQQMQQQQMQGMLQQPRPIISEAESMRMQPSGMEQPISQQLQQRQRMSALPPQVGQTQQAAQAPRDLPISKVLQARLEILKELKSKKATIEQVKRDMNRLGVDPKTQSMILDNQLSNEIIKYFLEKSGKNKQKAIAMAKKYGFGG